MSGMKALLCQCAVVFAMVSVVVAQSAAKPVPLFDGRTFQGWSGDTTKTWRIEDGAIVGGSLTETVPRNDFICTTREYSNFVLRLKFTLVGTEAFVNVGV